MSGRADPGRKSTARRLFLERRTYRRNRLQDAARLLPVLGAFLFFGPVFILTTEAGVGGRTGGWMVFFLGVWLGLIALTALVSWALRRLGAAGVPPEDRGGRSGV